MADEGAALVGPRRLDLEGEGGAASVPPERRWIGPAGAAFALTGLVVVSVPLAAPGPKLVPAARFTHARWLLGPYGRGFGLDGRAYIVLLFVAFALYLGVIGSVGRLHPRVAPIAIALLVGLFSLSPPLLSSDVFSYVSYDRLGPSTS